jgi:hypothetical protein
MGDSLASGYLPMRQTIRVVCAMRSENQPKVETENKHGQYEDSNTQTKIRKDSTP